MYGPHRKCCFVPGCKNTSVNAPSKLFLNVPRDYSRKVKWFKAARRYITKSKSTFFCCEDHFNLQQDMENYVRYQLMGGNILFKAGVVPHIFDCQSDRKRAASAPQRSLPLKRERRRLVEEALASATKETDYIELECAPAVADSDQPRDQPSTSLVNVRPEASDVRGIIVEVKSVGLQVKPLVSSKYVTCKMHSKVCDTASSPVTFLTQKDVATSPIAITYGLPSVKKMLFSQSSTSSGNVEESSPSYFPTTSDSDLTEVKQLEDKKYEQTQTLNITRSLVANKPKSYLGVPDLWFPHLVDLICLKSNLSKDNVLLTFMKIKLNDSLSRLGDSFGMSTSNASKIFKKSLLQIEHYLQMLIYWPEQSKIKQLLPIAFRARYSSVQSIIDCLEIQIEKPSDPVKQALTWSEYKKCNTLKYLVSSTPDGFINFISKGYGGRISDSLLVQESGYLEIVPVGCAVMADRGFKDIAKLLHDKNCQLIRPPSVSSVVKPTKAEVLESKRIASLRIHIERVIRRIREFEYLKPASVIDHSFIAHTDSVIVVACALINLQSSIIK